MPTCLDCHRLQGTDLALLQSPFRKFHEDAGAKFVDFAGWEMPLHYGSIVKEHKQTRASGSIFDVSHMGRLKVPADTPGGSSSGCSPARSPTWPRRPAGTP